MIAPGRITEEMIDMVSTALGYAAAFDQRTVGDTDITAWAMAIGDLPGDAVNEAIVAFYADETGIGRRDENDRRRVEPRDVRRYVRERRRDRLERTPLADPGTGEESTYRAGLAAQIAAIADGRSVDAALAIEAPTLVRGGRFSDEADNPAPPAVAEVLVEFRERRLEGAPVQPPKPAPKPTYDPDEYAAARKTLMALPDFGAAAQEAARASLSPAAGGAEVAITAAELVRAGKFKAVS